MPKNKNPDPVTASIQPEKKQKQERVPKNSAQPQNPGKRRRKQKDPTWRPRGKSRAVNTPAFTTENLLRLMNSATSPAKKVAILNSTNTPVVYEDEKHSSILLTPSKYQLSTPEAGPKTSHLFTPLGSKLFPSRIIEYNDGVVSVFLSEDKVASKELAIPSQPTNWIKKSPIPEASMTGMIDIPVTKKMIKAVEALKSKRKKAGKNPRKISQNKVMKIPARQALHKAGVDINDGEAQHCHFLSHEFYGDESQTVENMGIGTRQANAAMELVNRAIRKLLYIKNGPQVIYISAIPEWVPEFEKVRWLKKLTLIIKDGMENNFKHSAKVTFNMLSLAPVCVTDVRPVRDSIIEKFSGKMPKKPLSLQQGKLPIPTTPPSIKLRAAISSPYSSPSFRKKTPIVNSSYSSPTLKQNPPILPGFTLSKSELKKEIPKPDFKSLKTRILFP